MKIDERALPQFCELCNEVADRHHIYSRGSGGCDCYLNVIYLCRIHHGEVHALGVVRFTEKYNLELIWEFATEHYHRMLQGLTECSQQERPHEVSDTHQG